MDKAGLQEKLSSIEQQFNALAVERDNIGAEMFRLQGEYRLINELLGNTDAAPLEEQAANEEQNNG